MTSIVVPIVVALLSFAGTFTASWLGNKKTQALLEYRLEELEKRVDKHNNLIERTYKLEKEAAVIKEDLQVANHRISDLEEYQK